MAPQIILVGSNSIHMQRYVAAISQRYDQVVFITNQLDPAVQFHNVVLHVINFSLFNLKARFQIAKIIKSYTNPIVHIHQANSYAYHTLKAIKRVKIVCKTILTTWGSDVLVLPNRSCIMRHMVQFNLANSDVISSDSLYMSAKIKELCHSVKELHTINFGMQNFPESIDLKAKENIILSNRLHKSLYNIDKIIHAYAKLIESDPCYKRFKLVIAANGDQTDILKDLVRNLGLTQVVFTGHLSYAELIDYYRRAKIFISIPSSDATSLSVLEAMGYGCYPVLANLPANLEWVIDDFNGIINQNQTQLQLDLVRATSYTANADKYSEIVEFNHALIRQKGVFEDNIQKFIAIYAS